MIIFSSNKFYWFDFKEKQQPQQTILSKNTKGIYVYEFLPCMSIIFNLNSETKNKQNYITRTHTHKYLNFKNQDSPLLKNIT